MIFILINISLLFVIFLLILFVLFITAITYLILRVEYLLAQCLQQFQKMFDMFSVTLNNLTTFNVI